MSVRLLRHDRVLVGGVLTLVVALSWAYLLAGAGMDMAGIDGMLMPMAANEWGPAYFGLAFAMWAAMMAAMMLPSAAPMLLLFGTVARRQQEQSGSALSSATFAVGYLVAWIAFSAAAVLLQWGLERAALLSPMLETTSVGVAGAVLIGAGVYQWTPLKQTCLRRCRSPLEFLVAAWRPGPRGALQMGLRHGAYCLGCCWLLMLLLFVGGLMNLIWIGGLALFVLVEKLAPAGHWIGRIAGAALVAWGVATLALL
jgi:predicted metal-binding membrane protein